MPDERKPRRLTPDTAIECCANVLRKSGLQILDVDAKLGDDSIDIIAYDPGSHTGTHVGMGALTFVQVVYGESEMPKSEDYDMTEAQLNRMARYYMENLRWDQDHFIIPVRCFRFDVVLCRPLDEGTRGMFNHMYGVLPVEMPEE